MTAYYDDKELYNALAGLDDFTATVARHIVVKDKTIESALLIKATDEWINELASKQLEIHFRGGLIMEDQILICILVFKIEERYFDLTLNLHDGRGELHHILNDLVRQDKLRIHVISGNLHITKTCPNYYKPIFKRMIDFGGVLPPWDEKSWIAALVNFFSGFDSVKEIWERMDMSKPENNSNKVHPNAPDLMIKPPSNGFTGFSKN